MFAVEKQPLNKLKLRLKFHKPSVEMEKRQKANSRVLFLAKEEKMFL